MLEGQKEIRRPGDRCTGPVERRLGQQLSFVVSHLFIWSKGWSLETPESSSHAELWRELEGRGQF